MSFRVKWGWTPRATDPRTRSPNLERGNPCPGSSGVEQWIENPRVGGSIPPPGTIFLLHIAHGNLNPLISLGYFISELHVLHILTTACQIFVGVDDGILGNRDLVF